MSAPEHLINDLADRESALRFLERLAADHPSASRKLLKNEALLSDVLTLVAYSPLLATTLLQNPEYIQWLNRRRLDRGVRGKDEMLESLARFSLTHTGLDHQVMFARFRRRELLRIYLADIRRQATVAETTEQLSNLADAVLETALRIARQEMDNRFGGPLETDERGRHRNAGFCIVSLGKLGSRELNYSSDIDLLFLYSAEGETSGSGSRGAVTNREYFVKLAEHITRMIGQQTGEGATYRVDLRLRPHGRVGPLAMSVKDTAAYYNGEAHDWERQVLIRSRASAGDAELFRRFYEAVEPSVFSESQSVPSALRSVRLSKQKIDFELDPSRGIDVKLGRGGIREIEFIAQALQLAHGGRDRWIRSSHTLISITRLADRGLLAEDELSQLFEAYEFLRRLEHILQMENGLQTHLVPNDPPRRLLVARRMRCATVDDFNAELHRHTTNVHQTFLRVFSDENIEQSDAAASSGSPPYEGGDRPAVRRVRGGSLAGDSAALHAQVNAAKNSPLSKGGVPESSRTRWWEDAVVNGRPASENATDHFELLSAVSPKYAEILAANPELEQTALPTPENYRSALAEAVSAHTDLRDRLSALRRSWSAIVLDIAARDAAGEIDTRESKRRQTLLAEASIAAAVEITTREMTARYGWEGRSLPIAVMGLGKLGGAGIDYDSDLDIIVVYDDTVPTSIAATEFYARAVETFVNALSGMTREGSLYRVDLRLRPHGKNGPNSISARSFAEYVRHEAAVWELLAFLKIRAAGGNADLAASIEREIVSTIFERAAKLDRTELAAETLHIRRSLEKLRTAADRRGVVDIKYGPGGMLDVYFAIRYLQLRDAVPDDPANRSSDFVLDRLLERGSLPPDHHAALLAGYRFISELDHAIRLTTGRSTKLPAPNSRALSYAAARLRLPSPEDLLQHLSLHRISIRESFESVVAGNNADSLS